MAAKLNYQYAADALADKAGVPAALVSTLINAESAWDTKAVSSTGATGLGQFTQGTAKDYGLMGDGFDNRADAALNMSAMVRYLADLKKAYPAWRDVIGHYSGQGPTLAGYAKYAAGQALIATVMMVDGETPSPVPVPPQASGDLAATISDTSGHSWSGTLKAAAVAPIGAAAPIAVAAVAAFCAITGACSPSPPPQQIAAPLPAVEDPVALHPRPIPSLKDSTFYLVPGPLGPLAVPRK